MYVAKSISVSDTIRTHYSKWCEGTKVQELTWDVSDDELSEKCVSCQDETRKMPVVAWVIQELEDRVKRKPSVKMFDLCHWRGGRQSVGKFISKISDLYPKLSNDNGTSCNA